MTDEEAKGLPKGAFVEMNDTPNGHCANDMVGKVMHLGENTLGTLLVYVQWPHDKSPIGYYPRRLRRVE